MKLRFKGMKQEIESGCAVCGQSNKTKTIIKRRNTFYLPSGRIQEFVVGRIEDIPDEDAVYLLEYECMERVDG